MELFLFIINKLNHFDTGEVLDQLAHIFSPDNITSIGKVRACRAYFSRYEH